MVPKFLSFVVAVAFAFPLSAGCGQEDPGMVKVDKAAAITLAIDMAPDSGEEILKEHGVSKAEYMQLVFEVTKDERLNAAYKKKIGR